MKPAGNNFAEIKEQITYCVLNSLSGEADPSDDKLREIISDGCYRAFDGRPFCYGDNGKRSL